MTRHATVRSVRRSFSSKVLRGIFDAALQQGWSWRVSTGSHVILQPPPPGHLVSLSTTATDGGRVQASVAHARRQGLTLP